MEADRNVIVDVDPEEAQILIDLVELLFEDWYIARDDRMKHLTKIQAIAEERKQKQEPAPKLDGEIPEPSDQIFRKVAKRKIKFPDAANIAKLPEVWRKPS